MPHFRKDVGDKITGVGTSLSTHVTAPIAAVGAASLAAFKEVDELVVIATLLTYRWKKQMILSMAAGTILYMVLVQLVFV